MKLHFRGNCCQCKNRVFILDHLVKLLHMDITVVIQEIVFVIVHNFPCQFLSRYFYYYSIKLFVFH